MSVWWRNWTCDQGIVATAELFPAGLGRAAKISLTDRMESLLGWEVTCRHGAVGTSILTFWLIGSGIVFGGFGLEFGSRRVWRVSLRVRVWK